MADRDLRACVRMTAGFALLLGCELTGELVRAAGHLAVPGPVIGMLLLTLGLLMRRERGDDTGREPRAETGLHAVANGLISNMGLLFVPAGVGVIAQFHVIRAQWLPILAGLLGSTLLGLVVTALVMHWALPAADAAGCDTQGDCGLVRGPER